MDNFSEVGHAKNVANFEDLISFCSGYGATYNPTLNAIKIANMNTLKTNSNNALTAVISTFNAYKHATNNREIVFEPIKRLTSKIMAALKACGVAEQTVDDANTINYKIQGKSHAKLTKADSGKIAGTGDGGTTEQTGEESPKTISSSQQSYDSLIEHTTKLVDLLVSTPAYNPNENELKITSLNTLLGNMRTSNTAVINTYTAWSNARIARNDLLYKKVTGLVYVAQDCKNYVKSVYGASSGQYKQVSKLVFKKL